VGALSWDDVVLKQHHGLAAAHMALISLPYALHILAANTQLPAILPRALRGVDACAAQRIFMAAVLLATVALALATGMNPVPRDWAVEHFKLGSDIGLLIAIAWFEKPPSPALGAALSLLADVPSFSLLRWHALAVCGQATSAGQALVDVGLRAALLIAIESSLSNHRYRRVPPSSKWSEP
jgi:hypothetical protein